MNEKDDWHGIEVDLTKFTGFSRPENAIDTKVLETTPLDLDKIRHEVNSQGNESHLWAVTNVSSPR